MHCFSCIFVKLCILFRLILPGSWDNHLDINPLWVKYNRTWLIFFIIIYRLLWILNLELFYHTWLQATMASLLFQEVFFFDNLQVGRLNLEWCFGTTINRRIHAVLDSWNFCDAGCTSFLAALLRGGCV